MSERYAHSLSGQPRESWESLSDHLGAVGSRAAAFAEPFGADGVARVAGSLHDIGKVSERFQSYIGPALQGDEASPARGPDHSTAGAREAVRLYPGMPGRILAFCIAGAKGRC